MCELRQWICMICKIGFICRRSGGKGASAAWIADTLELWGLFRALGHFIGCNMNGIAWQNSSRPVSENIDFSIETLNIYY